jgi:hypothetical protein
MSEETQDHNDGTWSGLKKTIIGLVTTLVVGAGGIATNKLIGGEEKTQTQQSTPIININNTQTQQQSSGSKTVIIKEKSATPTQSVTPKPKKKEGDEFKEEAPKW